MHGPTDDAPGEDIQNRNEIEPALAGEDARGIGDPDLIGSLNVKPSDAIGAKGPP